MSRAFRFLKVGTPWNVKAGGHMYQAGYYFKEKNAKPSFINISSTRNEPMGAVAKEGERRVQRRGMENILQAR